MSAHADPAVLGGYSDLTVSHTAERPAAGTDLVARLAARLYDDLDGLTDRATARIVERIPAYHDRPPMPYDDLWWSVRRNIELIIRLVVEGRLPNPAELDARRELGRRRAVMGFPLADVMRAFRVGYLVVWDCLVAEARRAERQSVESLTERATLVWQIMDEVSSAVADAYRETVDAADVDERRRALALLDAIRRLPSDAERANELAADLGLHPTGCFVVAVSSGWKGRRLGRDHVVVDQPGSTVVVRLAVGPGDEPALASLLAASGAHCIGVGCAGAALSGAQRSLAEATLAHQLALTSGAEVVAYRQRWFDATVAAAAADLDRVLQGPVAALGVDPEAADTVRAWLAACGRATAAAAALHLHPNTVTYRIQRIGERTGLDLRTIDGLLAARVALGLLDLRDSAPARGAR